MEGKRNAYRVLIGKGRDRFEYLSIDGGIILHWMLKAG
jgi:hypothetical protein